MSPSSIGGMGNLHSVEKALAKVAPRQSRAIVSRAIEIERARKVVLPGDGAFDSCLSEIRRRGLEDAIRRAAREKPFFGVCVGMQALFRIERGRRRGRRRLGRFRRTARAPAARGGQNPALRLMEPNLANETASVFRREWKTGRGFISSIPTRSKPATATTILSPAFATTASISPPLSLATMSLRLSFIPKKAAAKVCACSKISAARIDAPLQ